METNPHLPWVIFNLLDQQFAVSASQVKEMVKIPPVVPVPGAPANFRGVMNLRGKVIPVIDMRLKMGMPSSQADIQDLVDLLHQREQDHKNWITELEASVREKREFTLATDHHKCAFGKWFDTFSTENRVLANCLEKFDSPHKKIHSIAIDVKAMEEENDFDGAFQIIQQTRSNELARMIQLFEEARSLLKEHDKEIALVIESKDQLVALAVDAIETIEKIPSSEIEKPAATTSGMPCITGIGKRSDNKGLAQILDINLLINPPPDTSSIVSE